MNQEKPLNKIMKTSNTKNNNTSNIKNDNKNITNSMTKIRSQIDSLDSKIIYLISNRIVLAKKIQSIKKQHQITKIDPKREKIIIQRLQKQQPKIKKVISIIYGHIFSHTRGKK